MRLQISSHLLFRLTEIARQSPDQEACGLLLGNPDHVTDILTADNVAAQPERRFEVDPAVLLAAHRAARTGGPRVIGNWHSHPTGSATPSEEDARCAAADGQYWIILGRHEARCWRAIENGPLHGRFEQVALAVV